MVLYENGRSTTRYKEDLEKTSLITGRLYKFRSTLNLVKMYLYASLTKKQQ